MRSFAILLLLIGITMVIVGYTTVQIKCPPPRIEYRFVPRTFVDEQLSGNSLDAVNNMFGDMDPFFRQEDNKAVIDKKSNFFKTQLPATGVNYSRNA